MSRCAILTLKCLFALCLFGGMVAHSSAQSNVSIEGMSFFENRNLASRLSFLHGVEPSQPAMLDAVYIEDSAFLLIEQIKRKGYLKPTVIARLTTEKGEQSVRWENAYSIQLDVDFVAESVVFEVEPGVLYYYENVNVAGVSLFEKERLSRFFIPGGVLFRGKSSRIFTHGNLARRTMRVLTTLDAMGYRSAREVSREVALDEVTGAVTVELAIETGRLHYVGQVEVIEESAQGESTTRSEAIAAGTIFTRDWEQDMRRELRNAVYVAGYPDANVQMKVLPDDDSATTAAATEKVRDLQFTVKKGKFTILNSVVFRGDDATQRHILERQVKLKYGEPLNILQVAEARRQIMGLGIYKEVGYEFETTTSVNKEAAASRDVVFELSPNQRKELKLLVGWGSYERARIGLDWEHSNPFGRAHRYDLSAKQSLKASRLGASYSIPQLFGSKITGYSNAEYSYREELSFDRTTAGASVGASTYLLPELRFSVEYGFFLEEADRDNDADFESENDATVGSITLRLGYDRRDNFLAPSAGYNLFTSFEVASEWLGGSVDFQKIEAGGSYHFALGESTLAHIGLRGGVIFSSGSAEENIPFNERFFPGGENSVRGYREGGAAPLDEVGDEVGAEMFLLANFELEQRLLPKFSIVCFFDAVGLARDGFSGNEQDVLTSVGLGLRYQTVVGPLRLEYGHNLNPREEDPDGILHLSVGFPF